ncbi:DUF6443 domain-containing protein, partial [Flavobacterium olei]|uniref:DUF6443 domain-containing protein n=1 Tax=Flavobacterium olei TaxID=1886782 RepID=UPI003219E153
MILIKKYIVLLLLLFFTVFSTVGQTFSDDNFIYTIAPKKAVQSANLNTLTKDEMNQNLTYFDGLGRPVQSRVIGQGGNGEDLITSVEYDGFGRQIREHLPFAAADNGTNYPKIDTSTILSSSNSFYSSLYEGGSNPYSEKQFEPSPLNRILKQAAPGNSWAMGSGHEIKL